MKILLIILPLLFCVPDTTKVDTVRIDTTQRPMRLFFQERSNEQVAYDINLKLDLLISRLELMNDSTKIK